jgi:two-component system OmpR family response regulator
MSSKILLLEPDIRLGQIYQQTLELAGHEVFRQTSAQTALNAVDKHQPDLIILELQLTAHNGVEFLYELRSYNDWQKIPVLIHSQVPPVLKAVSPMLWRELGIVGYLYKPSTKLINLQRSVDTILAVPA